MKNEEGKKEEDSEKERWREVREIGEDQDIDKDQVENEEVQIQGRLLENLALPLHHLDQEVHQAHPEYQNREEKVQAQNHTKYDYYNIKCAFSL